MYKVICNSNSVTLTMWNNSVGLKQSITVTGGNGSFVEMFLESYVNLYEHHKHMVCLKNLGATEYAEWRCPINSEFERLLSKAYGSVSSGADERMVTSIMEVANSMFIELHNFYR